MQEEYERYRLRERKIFVTLFLVSLIPLASGMCVSLALFSWASPVGWGMEAPFSSGPGEPFSLQSTRWILITWDEGTAVGIYDAATYYTPGATPLWSIGGTKGGSLLIDLKQFEAYEGGIIIIFFGDEVDWNYEAWAPLSSISPYFVWATALATAGCVAAFLIARTSQKNNQYAIPPSKTAWVATRLGWFSAFLSLIWVVCLIVVGVV